MRFVTPTRRRWASNYYITRCTGSSISWRWCGREDQHPAEGALRPSIELLQLEIRPVGEKMLEWGTCTREAGFPGPRLSSQENGKKNTVMAIRVGVNMSQFYSVSNSLSHTTLSIKWEVYFSKELCCSSLLCCRYDSACLCVCIVGHGYTTRWPLGFVCSVSGEVRHWPDGGFIHHASHPPCCFLWLQMFNLWV